MANFSQTDIIIIILIITIFVFLLILIFSPEKTCEPQIIYKMLPEQLLDQQYDEKNIPSVVYKDIFSESSPWIGGYSI